MATVEPGPAAPTGGNIASSEGDATTIGITIDPRRTAMGLAAVAGGLGVLSLLGDALVLTGGGGGALATKVVRMFDLDAEANVPTFFSVLLILSAALLLGVIAATAWRSGRRLWAGQWAALAVLIGALSFDEYASLHETFSEPFRDTLGGPAVLYFGWVVPATVFVALVAVASVPFLRQLDRRTRWLFVIAGAIYVGGALGVEFPEGWVSSGRGEDNWPYVALLTTQELMEMAGMIVFVYALLDFLRRQRVGVDVRLAALSSGRAPTSG